MTVVARPTWSKYHDRGAIRESSIVLCQPAMDAPWDRQASLARPLNSPAEKVRVEAGMVRWCRRDHREVVVAGRKRPVRSMAASP